MNLLKPFYTVQEKPEQVWKSHEVNKDDCFDKLELLFNTMPHKNEYSLPSLFLTDYFQIMKQCQKFSTNKSVGTQRMLENEIENYSENSYNRILNGKKVTLSDERASKVVCALHKKEIEKSIRTDLLYSWPVNYIMNDFCKLRSTCFQVFE